VTIGELRALYDTNHVVNLKDRLGTSRRLQRYVAQFDALPLGELTKMQVVSWHQEIGRTRGGTAANQALQQLHAMYARAQDWELYMVKTQLTASRSSRGGRGSVLSRAARCPTC
jgi:hypothetical protein